IRSGNEKVNYNKNDETLDITGNLAILDGYHRTMGIYKVYQYAKVVGNVDGIVDKLKSLMFPIRIVHYDIETCKLIFSQYAKGLKISTSKSESYDMSKSWNRIVDRLNKDSVFADKIDSNKVTIAKSDEKNIVTFSTLTNAIKESFPIIQDKQEEQDIYDFLVLFFKELTDIFPEILDYELRTISKEESLVCENVMFYGWMAIAEYLYLIRQKGGWQKKLKALENIDFNKDARIWNVIVRPGKTGVNIVSNKQTRPMLMKLCKEQFVIHQD
ncbi:MAG: DNA sulfur modification protein DndB, partial [Sarcina sp.]